MTYLLDTGILLRVFDASSADFDEIIQSLRLLRDRDETFAVTVQNLAEFWNVSTRPVENNGYGLSVSVVSRRIQIIERFCGLYTESLASFSEWKQLLVNHNLAGVAVHDARLVSVMLANTIPRILTLNVRDFARYSSIEALSPKSVLVSYEPSEVEKD